MTTDEDVDLTRKTCVGLLAAIHAARKDKAKADAEDKKLSPLVKGFLERHPEEVIWDGERHLEGRLEQAQGAYDLDTVSLAQKDPDLLLWAAGMGLLKIDGALWKLMQDKGTEAAKLSGWIVRMRGTTKLRVEEKR